MSLTEGKFKKTYYEITNVCNASCSFCPKNCRPPHFVSEDEFSTVISKLKNRAEYLYFHLMGEPLLHPNITEFASKAKDEGFKVVITSNGILSDTVGIPLVKKGNIYKISLSIHSYEANSFGMSLDKYISSCISLADVCAENGTVCVFRLWNLGTESDLNNKILALFKERYTSEWKENRSGFKLSEYVFLEWGNRFNWPVEKAAQSEPAFCYALRDQIGIHSNGTVVPCCLDSEGKIPLGNIYTQSIEEILASPKAKKLFDGFSANTAIHSLCKGCQYATRFK